MHHLLALLLAAHIAQPPTPKPPAPCWFPHGFVSSGGGGGGSGTLNFSQSANSGLLAALGGF